jgi:hypothetical protein
MRVPRSAIGIGMVVGLLVGGAAGLAAGLWVASSRPGAEAAVLVASGLLAAFGLVLGAVMGRPSPWAGTSAGGPDGPEADYRDPDPPER